MARWPTPEQKRHTFELLGYAPHGRQWAAHQSVARVLLVAGGQRSGKSLFSAMELLGRVPWCKRIAVTAQTYDTTRPEMQTIITSLGKVGGLMPPVVQPAQGPWSCRSLAGCYIETISLQEGPERLTGTGMAYDLVLIVEAGRIRYDAFLAARGRVAETRGDVILSGTLWDNWGWYADLYTAFAGPNHFEGERFEFPTWDNLAIFPGGEQDPEIERLRKVLPADEFQRLVAAKLVASPARMYPEFEYGTHVEERGFDDRYPVELAVDAGYYPSHYAVLAIQLVQEHVKLDSGSVLTWDMPVVVGEVYEHHQTHDDIIAQCRLQPWWDRVTRAVGGHETRQHQAAESTQEVWQNLVGAETGDPKSFHFDICDAGVVMDGVVRVKTLLKDPASKKRRLVVSPGCVGLLAEFQAYKRRTDMRGNVVSEQPEDANNDALDALRVWCVDKFGYVDIDRRAVPGRRRGKMRG